MYVFCYADIIYKITNNGIQVLGKWLLLLII